MRVNARARLLHPHDRRGPQALRAGVPAADLRQRRHLRGRLRGALLRRLRGVQDRGRARRRPVPDHGIPPERIEEKNYFFRLSAYQEQLLALYDERPDFVLPSFRYNEARSFIEGGLAGLQRQPRRAALGRADPVGREPGRLRLGRRAHQLPERAHLRAAGRGPARGVLAATSATCSARTSSASTASIWPALLLAAGYDVPQQLFVHGYLLLDDRKISKSLGNVIDPLDLIDVYGVDAVRFWALRVGRRSGRTGASRSTALHERYERELGNDLGNLLSRTTAMIARYRDGRLGARTPNEELAPRSTACATRLVARFDALRPHRRARGHLGARALAQPPRRARRRRGSSRRTTREPTSSTRSSTTSPTGCARSRSRSPPYLPETAPRILAALGQPRRARLGAGRLRR